MIAPDLLCLASGIEEFELFVAAVQAAGLEQELLLGPEPRTVLAPINAAFGRVSDALLERLVDARGTDLRRLLRSHVVSGAFRAAEMVSQGRLGTLADGWLCVDALPGTLAVAGAVVVRQDLLAANGVLHGVDRLLKSSLQTVRQGPQPNR